MKKEKIKWIGMIVFLIAIIIGTVGITYAFFSSGVTGEQEKLTVTTGTLALTFSDNNTGITASTLNVGESTTKEFMIENTGTLDATTSIIWNNLINTFIKGSFTYTFQYKTSEDGEWETTPLASGNVPQSFSADDYNLATDITIPVGSTYYYKLTLTYSHLSDIDQTDDANAVLTSNFKIGDKIDPALNTLAALEKTVQSSTPDFATDATTDETSDGLYAMADDYGTSYYYRGAVTDNYIKFAGFYWRIIRVNGDGSLRIMYDGTQAYANGTSDTGRLAITSQAWNASYGDAKYVGWMFGGSDGSASTSLSGAQTNTTNADIKDKVDSWYSTNLSSYATYIADVVYCNDRSITSGNGYGTSVTYYAAYTRFYTNKSSSTPTFTCPQKNDAFTVSDTTNGNGALTYPIGLITADEIVAAGTSNNSSGNSSYYLYKGSWYWSLSPYLFGGGYAGVYDVVSTGNLNVSLVHSSGAVAPVISLKAKYASDLSGSGSADDPYELNLN